MMTPNTGYYRLAISQRNLKMVISNNGMVNHNSLYHSPEDTKFSFKIITLIKTSNTTKAPDAELFF